MTMQGDLPVQPFAVQTRGLVATLSAIKAHSSPRPPGPVTTEKKDAHRKECSSFSKPIREVQSQVHREGASIANSLPLGEQGRDGVRRAPPLLPPSEPEASLLHAFFFGLHLHVTSTPGPRHTILNKYAWPRSMWEFWRVTTVISRNAQTPAKIHFPDAWLF